MKILFSIPYAPTFPVPDGLSGGHAIHTLKRGSDWGLRGVRKKLCHLWAGCRVGWSARRFDALVLCTVGIEAFVIGFLRRILCPATRVVVADILIPNESWLLRRVRRGLRGLDAFVCIRNGDMETLQAQFGVSSERCFFAPYPAPSSLPVSVERPEEEEPYLYSAGSAHRDWETLIAALRMLPYRAVISPGSPFRCTSDLPSHIRVLPPQPPESGRLWMAHAQAAVFSFEDTRLPSGPLVLLDAMVMAKPIVATRVNGTRDYLVHGETGLLVAPRDPVAMASAIRRVMEENGLARRLGVAAREVARTRFTAADFVGALIEACEGPCREEGRREPFLSARG